MGVNACEQEPSQLHGHYTHPSWPKALCIEPTGKTERAAATMYDAIGPRAQAHKVVSVGLRQHHGRETESGGHEFGSPLHKALQGSLEGEGTWKPRGELLCMGHVAHKTFLCTKNQSVS